MKVLNSYTKRNQTVQMVKNDIDILGGLYSVIVFCNDIEIKSKDGLCLDAACKIFNDTAKSIHNL